MELVIDASVVLKWYLVDEDDGQKALQILEQHVGGDVDLLAPTILPYEVLNALLVAERMNRIPKDVTETAFSAFSDLQITLIDPFGSQAHPLALARSHNRSIYDASYILVAKKHNIDLATGDKRLFNSVKDKLEFVKWLGDYDLSGII